MPTVFRKCKVCGVEYPYCKTVVSDDVFRYQDVACCPEHGSIYFAQILESRGVKANEDTAQDNDVNKGEPQSEVNEQVDDIVFDFDDEDDDDEDMFYDEDDDDEEDIDIQ